MLFTREDTATIMDGMVVRYKCGQDFEINASRNGVSTNGTCPMLVSQKAIDSVREYFQRAYLQFRHMEPNQRTLYNRFDPLSESALNVIMEKKANGA